jgi:hypothetical protein
MFSVVHCRVSSIAAMDAVSTLVERARGTVHFRAPLHPTCLLTALSRRPHPALEILFKFCASRQLSSIERGSHDAKSGLKIFVLEPSPPAASLAPHHPRRAPPPFFFKPSRFRQLFEHSAGITPRAAANFLYSISRFPRPHRLRHPQRTPPIILSATAILPCCVQISYSYFASSSLCLYKYIYTK